MFMRRRTKVSRWHVHAYRFWLTDLEGDLYRCRCGRVRGGV